VSLAGRLAALDPPWVHLLVGDGPGAPPLPPLPEGLAIHTLDGRRCPTKARLLAALARALAVPPSFGRNWDALEDALTDLSWQPGTGHLLVVTHADRLLAGRPREYATFVAILRAAGRAWATGTTGHPGRPRAPFHAVLAVAADRLRRRRAWRVPRLRA
jgi:hypothetical protein